MLLAAAGDTSCLGPSFVDGCDVMRTSVLIHSRYLAQSVAAALSGVVTFGEFWTTCPGNKKFRRKWCDACTWRDMNFFTPPVLENGVRFLALWAPTSGAAACVQCRLDR